jgi:hypothetical protein
MRTAAAISYILAVAYGPALCASCGATDGVEEHHLYLQADGCPDDLTIWLCHVCHGRAHGMSRRINISEATRAALKAARERGVRLGGYRGGLNCQPALGTAANAAAAQVRADMLAPVLAELRGMSLHQIAAELTARGIVTPRGGAWTATAVRRALNRIGTEREAN